ncbi:MAG: hypothetical protein EAZ85_15200 [Bacteroidetes bacterium]|nr:MAG: hypothetical protein EAZ85_15200 [Bacteroidota bacterium]TAG93059.1 MAG: hypothetical protein EAZ20_02000 [Bacteroidota bacterium]
MNFLAYYEQILNKGEDAFPTLIHTKNNLVWLGVYDGMGGSGGKSYQIENETYSGAYIGARKVKEITEFYLENYQNILNLDEFTKYLKENLDFFADKFANQTSLIKSKLLKQFPTTLCLLSWEWIENNQIFLQTFNAGDSRVYAFTPENCQLLTKDDLEQEIDCYENLRSESGLHNYIAANENFFITQKNYTFQKPCLLLVATDGVFHYFETPMHFEYIFLQTLVHTKSNIDNWQSILLENLIKYSSDDISFVISAVGFKDFSQMQNIFYARYQFLYQNFIEPYQKKEKTAEELWQIYQKSMFLD